MRVIITGATGMVGEGVLLEALADNSIKEILIVNRKPSEFQHPKLKEIIHQNFHDLSAITGQLHGYDACLFCLGVSSVGLKEEAYTKLTYDLTMHVAETLASLNPAMTFCYVSGAGTDSSEKGRSMWARVKGKTENDLKKLPFRRVFNFRPALIIASKGQKHVIKLYSYLSWMIPVSKVLMPNYITTMSQLGKAMIRVSREGYVKATLEVSDIKALGK